MRRTSDRSSIRIRFLGTGPARGRPGRGRSRRSESSILITSASGSILIDATRDFAMQARHIDDIGIVLITHSHRDATGGVHALDRWLRASVPLLSSRATIQTLRTRYATLARLELRAVSARAAIRCRDWRVVPLVVPHARDCTTFAWRLERGHVAIVYASDVAELTEELAAFCAGCDVLVLDGATWQRRIFTHLEIRSTAPVVARWPVGRILFTQLGRSTPPHDVLDRWLRDVDPRLGAAYDGLDVELGAMPLA